MDTQSKELPYFEDPPVIETVLGVFFRPIRQFNSVWQGVFWNECLRTDLPKLELRPPIEEVIERFEKPVGSMEPSLRWQVSDEPDSPRLWAKSESEDRILQIQRNALLSNWLRSKSPNQYRRFADRLGELEQHYQQLVGFLTAHKLYESAVNVTSCTVTYINHIPVDVWSSTLARTLTCWNGGVSDPWLPAAEQSKIQLAFAFPESHGRLHVNAIPVVQAETKQLVLQLELTARLALAKEEVGQSEVFQAIETGHEWIVRGFAALTRPEMHAVWRRVQ